MPRFCGTPTTITKFHFRNPQRIRATTSTHHPSSQQHQTSQWLIAAVHVAEALASEDEVIVVEVIVAEDEDVEDRDVGEERQRRRNGNQSQSLDV